MLRNKKPTAVSGGLKSSVRVGDPKKKYKISKGIVRRTTRGFLPSTAAIFTLFYFQQVNRERCSGTLQRQKFRNSLIS